MQNPTIVANPKSDKGDEEQLENAAVRTVGVQDPDAEKSASEDALDAANERRLRWKIDLYLIPWLSVLYLLCFLDRIGIGNARLYGMEEDLGLSDSQYLICLTMFFIPYALLEVPANILLKKLKPSIWLSSIMTLWGIVTICQGLVENFAGLLSIRILLGIFEAGFYPGTMYYLSWYVPSPSPPFRPNVVYSPQSVADALNSSFNSWYKRTELGLRMAIFSSSITTAGAFGGLLAAAISNMDGVADKGAWAWIFILEGIATVVAGILSFFLVQDFPDDARFLTEPERRDIIRRLQSDDQFSAGGEKLEWKNIRKSVTDWKTWLAAALLLGSPMYALSLFLPSIIAMLGYTATRANLLSVPVYFVTSIISWIVGYSADRLRNRGYFSIGLFALASASFLILLVSREPGLSYFGTFIVSIGVFPNGTNNIAWLSNNVEGSYKRSISMALMLTWGNLTGILSSNTYRRKDAPWYTTGHAISLGLTCFGGLGAIIMHILLRRENAARDRGERDEVIGDAKTGNPLNGVYESMEAAKKDKGDEWSGYRYIL